MAGGHRWPYSKDQLLATALRIANAAPYAKGLRLQAAATLFPEKFSEICSAQRFESAKQILFARDSGHLVAQLAVLKKEQSGNRADIVLERKTLIFVHVNLRYFDRIYFFPSDLIQQRGDHFAGAAPVGPKIDDHRLVVLRHFRSEEHTSELQSHSDLVCRLLL